MPAQSNPSFGNVPEQSHAPSAIPPPSQTPHSSSSALPPHSSLQSTTLTAQSGYSSLQLETKSEPVDSS